MEELKVGDWVRYTRVDSSALRDEGEIGQIRSINDPHDVVNVSWVNKGGFCNHNKRYLVKIQLPVFFNCFYSGTPPEKEKTMDIKRKADGGIVRGVVESCYFEPYGWVKESPDCVTYYRKDQWEPVEEWVKIEVNKADWGLHHKEVHHSGLPMISGVRYRYVT